MMEIKNIQDLEKQKSKLRAEVSEMESIFRFQNPRKSFGVITNGITEQYLGSFLDSKATSEVLPTVKKLWQNSLKLGGAKLLTDTVKKNITKSTVAKGLIGVGILFAGVLLVKRAKKELDDYQRKQTAKSLSELI